MKLMKYFFIFIGIAITTSVFAQDITSNQLKQIRSAIYNWVDKYLEYSYLSSEYDVEKYRSLFADNEVPVVNDYLPITNDERIALQEYTELFSTSNVYQAYPYTYEASIVIQEEQMAAKSYICVLAVQKSIMFSDEEKLYEYPKKDYTLYITLEYDFKTKKIQCTEIHTSDQLIVEYVLRQDNDSISHTYIEGKDTLALLKNKELLPVVTSKFMYHYPFDNKIVEVKRDTMRHNFHVGAIIGPSFYLSAFNTPDFYNHSQKAGLIAGFNLGFYHQCHLKENHRFGIEYGLLFSRNTLHILGDYKTSYNTVDPDGGEYLRIVDATGFHEQLKMFTLSIPVSLRYDFFLTPNLSLFAGIGTYASYDLLQQSNVSVNVQYSGYYDWLFDLTIDKNGIYDFGNFQQEGSTQDICLSNFNVGLLFNVGCQYFIPKSHWSIEPSIRYQTSLFTPLTNPEEFNLLEKDGELHSATNLLDNIYKHNLTLQLNFNFHF